MDERSHVAFNSPLEAGLRVLILLVESHPMPLDIQKLVFLDYLAVHSADVGGPDSLHPPTPHRAAELTMRRELLDKGTMLFASRGLIIRDFDTTGFFYVATEEAGAFLMALLAPYTLELRQRAVWVVEEFGARSTEELSQFFSANLDRWGGEFTLSFDSEI